MLKKNSDINPRQFVVHRLPLTFSKSRTQLPEVVNNTGEAEEEEKKAM